MGSSTRVFYPKKQGYCCISCKIKHLGAFVQKGTETPRYIWEQKNPHLTGDFSLLFFWGGTEAGHHDLVQQLYDSAKSVKPDSIDY